MTVVVVQITLMIAALSLWGALTVYVIWFLFGAKTFQPLTFNQLALTWRTHKQKTGCKASRIRDLLTRNNEIVGFECDCGSTFVQKRLITQRVPTYTKNRLKTAKTSNKKKPPQDTQRHLRKLGIRYSHLKEV